MNEKPGLEPGFFCSTSERSPDERSEIRGGVGVVPDIVEPVITANFIPGRFRCANVSGTSP